MIYSISLTLFSALSFLSYIQGKLQIFNPQWTARFLIPSSFLIALASNSTSITTTSASANSISLLSATQTVSQTLLSVPAYPTASGSSYSNTTALGLAKYLPSYSYNLTSEVSIMFHFSNYILLGLKAVGDNTQDFRVREVKEQFQGLDFFFVIPEAHNYCYQSLTTRIAICNQTTQFCSSSACTSPTASISTNL